MWFSFSKKREKDKMRGGRQVSRGMLNGVLVLTCKVEVGICRS